MRTRTTTVLLPVSLLAANGLNMAGIIVLPKILDAGQFALFSLASSIGLFVVALLFEWSRISIMRYGVAKDPTESAKRKHVLNSANRAIAVLLFGVALYGLLFPHQIYLAILSMSLLFATSQALFEARQACFRAEFQDAAYIRNLILRSLLGFCVLCTVAYLTNSALYAMWAWAASFAIVLIFSGSPLRAAQGMRMDWKALIFMVKFGLGVAVSAVATASLAPLLRLIATHQIPLEEAGKMMLAMDISQKVIGVLGVSINLLIFQATVRAREFGDDGIVNQRITRQISIVFAVISASVIGFLSVNDAFASLFLPDEYRSTYNMNIAWAMVGAGLIGFRSFALDTIFVVTGRSQIGIVGPVFTGVVSIVSAVLLGIFHGFSSQVFSMGMLIGGLAGVGVSFCISKLVLRFEVAWAEILKIAAANIVMWLALRLTDDIGGVVGLLVSVSIGAFVFGTTLIIFNVVGLRATLRSFVMR